MVSGKSELYLNSQFCSLCVPSACCSPTSHSDSIGGIPAFSALRDLSPPFLFSGSLPSSPLLGSSRKPREVITRSSSVPPPTPYLPSLPHPQDSRFPILGLGSSLCGSPCLSVSPCVPFSFLLSFPPGFTAHQSTLKAPSVLWWLQVVTLTESGFKPKTGGRTHL